MMEGEGSRIERKEKDKKSILSCSIEGGNGVEVVKEMVELIEKVGSYVGFRNTQRKECLNLVRRLKLLTPLLEEIKELDPSIPNAALSALVNLKKALLASKKVLKTCNSGSKIFLVRTHHLISFLECSMFFSSAHNFLITLCSFFFSLFFF